jgi:hypothetical protein
LVHKEIGSRVAGENGHVRRMRIIDDPLHQAGLTDARFSLDDTHEASATKLDRQDADHWTQAKHRDSQAVTMAIPDDDAWMQ